MVPAQLQQALLAAALQARRPQPPPASLAFTSPFAPQPQPLPQFNAQMVDPMGDQARSRQVTDERWSEIMRAQKEADDLTQQAFALKAQKEKRTKMPGNEALIAGGIAAIARLLGARDQYVMPALQQYMGARQGQFAQQDEDAAAQRDAQAQSLAQQGQARRSQIETMMRRLAMEQDQTDKQDQRAFDLKKLSITTADDMLRAQTLAGMLPFNQQLAAAKTNQANATAGLTTEKATDMKATRPARLQALSDASARSQAMAAKALSGVGVDKARAAQILKDVEWADEEYSSKIAERSARLDIARERLAVTMRGQDLASQRAAQKQHTASLKALQSPVEKQIAKLENERDKLNGELARQLAEEDDEAAVTTQRLLSINAARHQTAARKLYEINQQIETAPRDEHPPGDFNLANPFGVAGRQLAGAIGRGGSAKAAPKPTAKPKAKPKASGTTRSGATWEFEGN
jgi:hypothetical protein